MSNQHAAIRGGHDSDIHPGQSDLAPSPITLYPFYVSCPVSGFPLIQLRQHIPSRLGARVSLRPVRLLHHPHAAAAGRRRRRLLPHLHLEGRGGGRGMEIGSVQCGGEILYSITNLQTGMDHFSLMESLVEGKNEFLLKKLEFEPGTLSLFRVRTKTTCTYRVILRI